MKPTDQTTQIARPSRQLLDNAKKLRAGMTDAEQLLWKILRARRFMGLKFRRQVPVLNYVLDFYCHELKLAIELDGGQHNEDEVKPLDALRTQRLSQHGIKVIRFWNHEMLMETENVLTAIYQHCIEINPKLGSLSPNPSPGGRGE